MDYVDLKRAFKHSLNIFKDVMGYELKLHAFIQVNEKMENLGQWQNMLTEEDDKVQIFHLIEVNSAQLNTLKDLYETILHELCHAMQYELAGVNGVSHGLDFYLYFSKFHKHGYDISSGDFDADTIEKVLKWQKDL
jgi:hypothetical protein